jgi:predicted phage terminase large subunit-like protein
MLTKQEEISLIRLMEIEAREQTKTNYAKYVEYIHEGRWLLGKHLLFICEEIEKLLNNQMPEEILIISMPPQHGKSMCVTETLPSYFLGKYPDGRVIEVSYGDDLARRFGRSNKRKIEQFGKKLFNIELSRDSRSDTEFSIEGHQGSMISRGIMAGITGQPGDLIIIDDPIKNRQEADSETYRERMWEEWLNSINTRRSATCKVILIQTRWHEDDLAGRLIKNLPGKVKVINLPCEAEENDILGRSIGGALFPEIGKDKAWMQEFKRGYMSDEGTRAWNALYQGRPTAQEGNMIKRAWWKWYKELPLMPVKIISVDATFKDGEKNDFVSIQVWGKSQANMYLIDRTKARMDFPTTLQAIKTMKAKHKDSLAIYIEDKANGSAIIQVLRTELGGIIAVEPVGSKEARVSAASPQIEAGNVYLPELCEWVHDFVEECSTFPTGAHDDDVDAMSQAILKLKDMFTEISQGNKRDPFLYREQEETLEADQSYINY